MHTSKTKNFLNVRLNKFLFFCSFLISTYSSIAQSGLSYYFPIRPGETNYLSGTMGEIRYNHFHAGIDIKTSGVEGLPVYAIDDGYVSRIKVSTGGYGNALYILHPDGKTSVYAHLWKYGKEIAEYVRKAQYQNKSFEIELFPEKNELKVERGQAIGLSGNSGSSGGPHLHFEIRNSSQVPLNPLIYKFEEIKDNIPPAILKMALITRDKKSRINHQYGRFNFDLISKNGGYTVAKPIEVYGNIGVQILGHDKLNGASNRNGIPSIEMTVDGRKIYDQLIDKVSFYESREILVFYDYDYSVNVGGRYQKLYIDDGNSLNFYDALENNGIIKINDNQLHEVRIDFTDAYGNSRFLEFQLQGAMPLQEPVINDPDRFKEPFSIRENLLIIPHATEEKALVYANRMKFEINPDYNSGIQNVYLWNLSRGIPDSVVFSDKTITDIAAVAIPSNTDFTYFHNKMDLEFSRRTLFDTLFLNVDYDQKGDLEMFRIHQDDVPLRSYFTVTLKPQKKYNNQDQTAVYSVNKYGRYGYAGGEWENNKIKFSTRDFGNFTILTDTIAPTITAARVNSNALSFYIRDKLSGVKSYEMKVNGKWVLMNYDYKRDLIWSEKLDENQPFEGELLLKVEDNAGNERTYQSKL